jgi:YD repeat-containing protein
MMVTAGGVTRTQVYTYDNIYQVTGVDYPPELSYLATDSTFNYDAAGNRTSVIDGSGTVTFWWKVSSEEGSDYLEFWLDGVRQSGSISGSVDWEQKSFTVGAGTHTFKWRYSKSGSGYAGDDCGYVDWVQWSGSCPPAPEPDPAAWLTLAYRYDAAGRRVEKKYDSSVITKYVYDGDHCIAEYDVSNNLRRKYIYGPGVDEPISMIEAAGSYAGTYYYHFDALGSVVGLTNASGNTVEVYEYDVYGRLGASDASHPNRFMFTGREYDREAD